MVLRATYLPAPLLPGWLARRYCSSFLLTANASDDPAVRSGGVTSSTATLSNLVLSGWQLKRRRVRFLANIFVAGPGDCP